MGKRRLKNVIIVAKLCYSSLMVDNKKVVAVVEDEENLRNTLKYALEKEGYSVETFDNGSSAWDSFKCNIPDLIVSDIMMPLMDGLELCKHVRTISKIVPFMFLTSKDEEFDRILGLELGADDYLCKPFSLRELTTRIKVLFRRINLSSESKKSEDFLQSGKLVLKLNSYIGEIDNKDINLTVTEFRLLHSLIEMPGHVKTREQLIKKAYPDDNYISDRNVDCHIKRLRKKINKIDPDFDSIKTVYGLGYKLVTS